MQRSLRDGCLNFRHLADGWQNRNHGVGVGRLYGLNQRWQIFAQMPASSEEQRNNGHLSEALCGKCCYAIGDGRLHHFQKSQFRTQPRRLRAYQCLYSFKPVNAIDLLDVNANNGNVNVHLNNSDTYNYAFNTTYGEIKVPDNLKSMLLQKKNAYSFVNYKNKSHSVLSVKSNFGNVLLTTNPNLK